MADMTPQELQDRLYWWKTTAARAVDGDTVGDLVFQQGFGNTKEQDYARLVGIDCPEINHAQSPYERSKGVEARAFVRLWLVANPELIVHTHKSDDQDDFGRYLVEVYSATTGQCLNDLLVRSDLAVVSPDGKVKWRDSHPAPVELGNPEKKEKQ